MNEIEFLQQYWPEVAEAYQGLFGRRRVRRSLSDAERWLILVSLYAVHGAQDDVVQAGRSALQAGACPDAVAEAILTAGISRGDRAIKTGYPFLSQLGLLKRDRPNPGSNVGQSSPMEYFETELGELPAWVRRLDEFCPESLKDYVCLRSCILSEGALSQKLKDLITMVLNAMDGNGNGVNSHARSALRVGGDRAEVLEALLIGVGVGGIIVWINGVECLRDMDIWKSPYDGA